MKLTELHRLFTYNKPSGIGECYLLNLPAILQYPNPSESTVRAMINVISSNQFDTTEQVLWQEIRLLILEPEWLQSAQRKKHHRTLFKHIVENPRFLDQILNHYELVSLFEQTPYHQESLLFSMCCLQQFIDKTNDDQKENILCWTQHLYETISKSPTNWKLFIKGADWLIEEFQVEEGQLYDTLYTFSTIKLPVNSPESAIESSIGLWAQQQEESDLLTMRDNMTNLDGIIRDAFSKLGQFTLK